MPEQVCRCCSQAAGDKTERPQAIEKVPGQTCGYGEFFQITTNGMGKQLPITKSNTYFLFFAKKSEESEYTRQHIREVNEWQRGKKKNNQQTKHQKRQMETNHPLSIQLPSHGTHWAWHWKFSCGLNFVLTAQSQWMKNYFYFHQNKKDVLFMRERRENWEVCAVK